MRGYIEDTGGTGGDTVVVTGEHRSVRGKGDGNGGGRRGWTGILTEGNKKEDSRARAMLEDTT